MFAYLHGSFLLEVPCEDIDVALYLREGTFDQQDSLQYAFSLANTWHERGVNDEALAGRLQAMARFRNLLVLRYWQVDDQRVLRIARKEVGYLLEFLRQVGAYLGATLQEARRDSLPC